MKGRIFTFLAFAVVCVLDPTVSSAQRMEAAPLEYEGSPLRSIYATDGHVFALYGQRDYGREWIPLTTDTVNRIKMMSDSTLLSPTRDRYFYVAIAPAFSGVHRTAFPNFDPEWGNGYIVDQSRYAGINDVLTYVRVHRLSGEPVTTIPLTRMYGWEYSVGRWLGDRWICLQSGFGRFGCPPYSFFVNVQSGEKRLVGLPINDERVTSDSRFLTFCWSRVFCVNFRPVYPIIDEPIPDMGDASGWKTYREKYVVRQEKKPWQRLDRQLVVGYELLPYTHKAVLLVRTPAGLDPRQWQGVDAPTTPTADLAGPEVVVIDLDKADATKDLKQYSTSIAVLPKAMWPHFLRDDKKGEILVYGGDGSRTPLWRRSFAELAAPAP